MFQGLRESSPFYILYKSEPRLEVGEVISVSSPVPQFGNITYQSGNLVPPKNVVDVKVSINGESVDFQKLPADASIADFGSNGIVVSESRDAIINEISGFKKASERVLADVERHKHVVTERDTMLTLLNPQLKREAEQAEEIENLKRGMSDLRGDMNDIKGMLAQALKHSSKSKEE